MTMPQDGPVRGRPSTYEEEFEATIRLIGVSIAHSERWAYSRAEVAEALGVSEEFFERYIAPEIRCIRRGRRRLFAYGEILFWLWTAAEPHTEPDPGVERVST